MATRKDPYRNCNFLVEIDGITQAGFSDCSGLGSSTDPIEYREGGDNTTVRKLPGLTKYTNISLKWGLSDSRELYDWYRKVITGKTERRNGSIVVLDADGVTEVVRWNFFNAWPTKLEAPSLSAKGNEVAIETLELAHEGLERA
ncbi:MAG: phage tail protein [Rhizobacter sp.]